MGKKDKKEEQKPKKNNLKAFLKKRAPLYLAGIALIVISANGVLSEKHLDNFLIDLSEEEQIVVDILMQYNGPNESGLNVKDAIENKINEKEAQSVANNSQTNNTNKLLQTLQLLKNNLWQKTNTQVNSQTNTKQPQEWTTIQKINWKLYKIHIRWNEWQDQHWGKYKVWKDENWKIHLTPLA